MNRTFKWFQYKYENTNLKKCNRKSNTIYKDGKGLLSLNDGGLFHVNSGSSLSHRYSFNDQGIPEQNLKSERIVKITSDILPESDIILNQQHIKKSDVIGNKRQATTDEGGALSEELSNRKVMKKGNTLVIEISDSVRNKSITATVGDLESELSDSASDCNKCDLIEVTQNIDTDNIVVNSEGKLPLPLTEGPLAKLWSGRTTPLMQPVHAKHTAKILSRLNINLDKPNITSDKAKIQNTDGKLADFPFQIQYDVYLPKVHFRKSCPRLPNYRVTVCKSSVPLPTHEDVKILTGNYNDAVPLLFAVCTMSSVSFYCFSKVQLPELISIG